MVLAFVALLLQFSAMPQGAIQQPVIAAPTPSGSREVAAEAVSANASGSEVATIPANPAGDNPGSTAPIVSASSARNAHVPGGIPPSTTDADGVKESASGPDEVGDSLSTIRVSDIRNPRTQRIEEARVPSRRSWLALVATEHAAAAFDAYSTRLSVSRGAVEDDPLMRPFAHSDAIYAAAQVGPVFFDYLARRMQRSDNLAMRRFWWLPQSVSTGVSLFAGVHNLHVANSAMK